MFYNNGYEALGTGILAATLAQIIKFVTYFVVNKKINFKCLTTTGGMPSSHSAGVVGLATTVGFINGFESIDFSIACCISLVVMYDAAGVRRAAGKIAATLNKMKDEFYKHDASLAGERLKELLGHTPIEVFAGALLGIAFSYFVHFYLLGSGF